MIQRNPHSDIFIWLSIYLLFRITGEMAAILTLGIDQADAILSLESPQIGDRNKILVAQGLAHFISYTLAAIVLIVVTDKGKLININYPTPQLIKFSLLSVGVLLLLMPTLQWLVYLNKLLPLPNHLYILEQKAQKLTDFILLFQSLNEFLLALLVMAILPAIGEELLFRAVLQNKLMAIFKNPHLSVFMCSAIFSFLHLQFAGFVPRLFLGVIFGYTYFYSGNIILSIVLHLANNGLTLTAAYLSSKSLSQLQDDKLFFDLQDYLTMVSTFGMAFLLAFYLISRFKK